MRRRAAFGAGPLRFGIWPAIVLLAAGAARVSPAVVDHARQTAFRAHASVYVLPPLFEVRPFCPVITVSQDGACPLPAIPAHSSTARTTIFLCSESLCGRGFHPGDTIMLLANRAEGSTFWRTVADRSGNFRSALPAPLCHFAPIGLTAFDTHADRSNQLSLATTGCDRSIP
jgi:hypothetical protein